MSEQKQTPKFYGWLSLGHREIGGCCLYRKADSTEIVEVTLVTDDPDPKALLCKDMKFVGELGDCVQGNKRARRKDYLDRKFDNRTH